MRKWNWMLFCIGFTGLLSAGELRQYYLGRMDLAGMVPTVLPAEGTELFVEELDKPLRNGTRAEAGYLPMRFREPFARMREQGLQISVEVCHVYQAPLPGKFISVEIWVTTAHPEKLVPLIYAVPTLAANAQPEARE